MVNEKKLEEKVRYNMDENMNILKQDEQNFMKNESNYSAVQELIMLLSKNDDKKNSGGRTPVKKKIVIRSR